MQQTEPAFHHFQRGVRLPEPVTWTLRFGSTSVFTLRFDGELWSTEPADAPDADVYIETTPQAWATFLLTRSAEERQRLLEAMRVTGEQTRVEELLGITWLERQV